MREGAIKRQETPQGRPVANTGNLHPAWCAFLRFCLELEYGDIERLRIQDGLPVLAELAQRKVEFR